MTYLRYFPFVVATSLLALAGVFHSVGFATATVALLAIIGARDTVYEYFQARTQKATIPDEVKKQLQDLAGRVTSIEAGIARRGF
jgi:hypothetical protein